MYMNHIGACLPYFVQLDKHLESNSTHFEISRCKVMHERPLETYHLISLDSKQLLYLVVGEETQNNVFRR